MICRDRGNAVCWASPMSLSFVFFLGVIAIAEFFLLWLAPAWAILVFATGVLGLVLLGFALRNNGWFLLFLPALSEPGTHMMEGMVSARYPQVFLFRIKLLNLYLLGLATFYGVVLAVLALTGRYPAVFSYYSPIAIGMVLAAYALLVALVWLKERRLVRMLRVSLGQVSAPHAASVVCQVGYQYFDSSRQRRGGIAQYYPLLMSPPRLVTPVFFEPGHDPFSKPGFAFWFHRFDIVDTRHTPAFLAEQAKRQQNPPAQTP
jgi:hypothetical protein